METTDLVRKAIKAGKSADDIKKLQPPGKWKTWGTGFIKTDLWMETIYKSLTRK